MSDFTPFRRNRTDGHGLERDILLALDDNARLRRKPVTVLLPHALKNEPPIRAEFLDDLPVPVAYSDQPGAPVGCEVWIEFDHDNN
jgi:hypothetical protein